MNKYWNIDPETREVLGEVTADKWNTPRNALLTKPLPSKEGYLVVAKADLSGSEYIEDNRGKTVYLKSDCTRIQTIRELGPIDESWTQEKPLSLFDEWINDTWMTNESNKYIAEYNQVDSARRSAYSEVSDPLYMEAWRKESKGLGDEAAAFRQQADAAVELIQAEHPWPTPPELSSEV